MAYNEYLEDRINQLLNEKKIHFMSKKMMGGRVYMVEDKMFCGIHFDKKRNMDLLMARIGEEATKDALKRTGCHPMDFTGRPMKGYVFVDPDGFDLEEDLSHWLELCIAFNPLAIASKKRKK